MQWTNILVSHFRISQRRQEHGSHPSMLPSGTPTNVHFWCQGLLRTLSGLVGQNFCRCERHFCHWRRAVSTLVSTHPLLGRICVPIALSLRRRDFLHPEKNNRTRLSVTVYAYCCHCCHRCQRYHRKFDEAYQSLGHEMSRAYLVLKSCWCSPRAFRPVLKHRAVAHTRGTLLLFLWAFREGGFDASFDGSWYWPWDV